jgi:ribose transport system permease protein
VLDPPQETIEPTRTTAHRLDAIADQLRKRWILWVLLGISIAFAVVRPTEFATIDNGRNIAIDTSVLLVMAVGTTYVLIAGGIDLSIGSVLVFSTVLAAKLSESAGLAEGGWNTVVFALVVSLAAGLVWGIFNGILIAYLRIQPLIGTLGTLGMALGLAEVLSQGLDIRAPSEKLSTLGTGRWLDQFPYLVLIAAATAVVGGLILVFTRFGRHTYAVGSNRDAAIRAGIDVKRHLLKVYSISGLLSGLAGFMSLARFSTTTISGHDADVLQVVAGVILGGTSLFGGVGGIFGTAIGMFIPSVLQNGFVIVGFQAFWQEVAVGAVLIVAVYVDQVRRQRDE